MTFEQVLEIVNNYREHFNILSLETARRVSDSPLRTTITIESFDKKLRLSWLCNDVMKIYRYNIITNNNYNERFEKSYVTEALMLKEVDEIIEDYLQNNTKSSSNQLELFPLSVKKEELEQLTLQNSL